MIVFTILTKCAKYLYVGNLVVMPIAATFAAGYERRNEEECFKAFMIGLCQAILIPVWLPAISLAFVGRELREERERKIHKELKSLNPEKRKKAKLLLDLLESKT